MFFELKLFITGTEIFQSSFAAFMKLVRYYCIVSNMKDSLQAFLQNLLLVPALSSLQHSVSFVEDLLFSTGRSFSTSNPVHASWIYPVGNLLAN